MTVHALKDAFEALRGKTLHVVGLGSTECTALLQVLPPEIRETTQIHDFAVDMESCQARFNTTHVALPREKRTRLFESLVAQYPRLHLQADYLSTLGEDDWLFVPQSWDLYPPNAPLHGWVERNAERVFTLMDLYLRHLPCRIVGVTGTNGKTTVASMVATLASQAGLDVVVSGNHRYHAQLLPELDSISPEAIAVLEISHKHLARIDSSPDIAILTNVAGDHLDQFDSFEDYASRKRKLITCQREGSVAILNGEDPECVRAAEGRNRVLYVLGEAFPEAEYRGKISHETIQAFQGSNPVFEGRREKLVLPGEHNARNCWMAMAALHALGVSWNEAYNGISSIRPVKHRLEYLRSIEGNRVYDDTAATSPAATIAAVKAVREGQENVVVIVGGEAKGNDYTELRKALNDPAIHVIGIGGDVCDALEVEASASLVAALENGFRYLKERQGAVLISPAGAGFHSVHNQGGGGLRQLVRRWGRNRVRG